MQSLTAKLVLSHLFVIGLTLGLVLLLSSALVRRYESDVQQARLQQIAVPLTLATTIVSGDRRGADRRGDPLVSLDVQAEQLDVRLLVFDPAGMVVYDTDRERSLTGQTLGALSEDAATLRNQALERRGGIQTETLTGRRDGPFRGDSIILTATGRSEDDFVLGVVSSRDRFPLISEFLRPILMVTGIALLLASIAGYLLSRRIAAPIVELTAAANAMAAGNLQQQVPQTGSDEIGRLVAAFNVMSANVANTAESQKNLLANVAHELRTPLTSIRGYAQALGDDVLEDPVQRQRAVVTIQSESARMQQLIEQLLDLARFEAGQNELSRDCIPLEPLVGACKERFEGIASERTIKIETALMSAPCTYADRFQLERVLDNLVSNAIRHSKDGATVSVSAEPVGTDQIEIRITDHGEGIPPAELPFVFDRFRRGGHGDVGLGLAITREIVLLHGGQIEIDSTVGRGTKVRVTLPACSGPGTSVDQDA